MVLHVERYAGAARAVLMTATRGSGKILPMAPPAAYALLDVGDGRRLERFAGRIVDRPHPAVTVPPRDPGTWRTAHLRFRRYAGWEAIEGGLEPWPLEVDGLTLELRPTPAGQLGVFPEQAPNWRWLREQVATRATAGRTVRLLNLFGYTGAATLAAAQAGASVVHVDASRPSVAWARANADRSGLGDRPIRWLVDDAEAFVAREVRRGRRYDAVVLDPPSYGQGGRGGSGAWRLAEGLPGLLDALGYLLAEDPIVLLSAHTPGFDADRLADALDDALGLPPGSVDAGSLALDAESGARLPLGAFARSGG